MGTRGFSPGEVLLRGHLAFITQSILRVWFVSGIVLCFALILGLVGVGTRGQLLIGSVASRFFVILLGGIIK